MTWDDADVGGIGGTLAGNALSMAAIAATLTHVLTDEAFARMIPLAERWAAGVDEVIRARGVPWHVTRLGARASTTSCLTRRAPAPSSGRTATPSSSGSSTSGR